MAGREKKTKNLTNTNASRESPTTSKQTTLLSYISSTPVNKSDGADLMNSNSSSGESPAGGQGRRGVGKGKAPRNITKKLNPNTKINTLRGRKKTKANFKLNIIKTQTKQSAAGKAVNRRGRPPLKKVQVKVEPLEKNVEDESPPSEDPGAKTRGRKRVTAIEGTDDKQNESTETNKSSSTKDSDSKKTVIKNIPKKVVKKKQLIVAQKCMTKKKVLLVKQILKSDAKQVDPKVLKKNLTAKLKSVSEKLEAKKDIADKDIVQVVSESMEVVLPISEIKKEPDLLDIPLSIPNSRSSSPRTGNLRKRNSADLSITKYALNDISAIPSGIKSPYSTRSERSRSPFPAVGDHAQKLLRNGKQRKLKGGLKNALLSETVGQELKKRRRLLSDTKVGDLSPESLDELKKVKRLRSCSRDGSEISKCSDVTESDLSFCDTLSIDTDNNKTLENKDEIKVQGIIVDDIKTELSSPENSPSSKTLIVDSDVCNSSKSIQSEVIPAVDNVQNKRGDSMDNENNNTDDKIKTDVIILSDKLVKSDAIDPIDNALKLGQSEKIAEKSLILDNMSKTFNETSLSSRSKSIRRSARQRKSTVKAKEQEETVLTEKDALESELSLIKAVKADTDSVSTNSSLNESVSDVTITDKKEDDFKLKPAANVDDNSSKITTKKFYGDSIQNVDTKSLTKVCALEDSKVSSVLKSDSDIDTEFKKSDVTLCSPGAHDGEENVKLYFDEDDEHEDGPVDDSLKENIQTGYSSKPFGHQDIDKLIDKLRNFEELDKRRQEEKCTVAEKVAVMVTNDVVLIPKSNMEHKALKDLPNTVTLEKSEKSKENVLSCFENNSAISIVKKDHARKSFDIELPSSVTLIKRTGTSSRKHSTGSTNSKDNDSVTIVDKALGKDVTLELRKSIDKGILSLETTPGTTKSSTISTGNGQSISISFKPQPVVNVAKDCVTVTPTQQPTISPTQTVTIPSTNPVTALISFPTPNPLMITPVPLSVPVVPTTSAISIEPVATVVPTTPFIPAAQKIQSTSVTPTTTDIPKAQDALKLLNTQLIPESSTVLLPQTVSNPSVVSITPAISIVPNVSILPTPSVNPIIPLVQSISTLTSLSPALIKTSPELTITPEICVAPVVSVSESVSITTTVTATQKTETIKKLNALITVPVTSEKVVSKKAVDPVASLASMTLPFVSQQLIDKPFVTPLPPAILPLVESPEKQKQKEKILRTLGLLTLKEADEAKLEKQKQKELLIKSSKSTISKASVNNDGYTGTLKTVIKINRTSPDKKKSRSPLKMTFQKSKSRGSKLVSDGGSGDSESDDSPHYTIHKEFGGSSSCAIGASDNHLTSGGHRKTHYSNRFNNHESTPVDPLGDVAVEASPATKEATLNLVIPEKASSFAIHPGRLCLDQCFYCGGKFGLFDTPCHVAQIKSLDRQKKILDNEEKLTVDSCLCDACYRHVDRRANCPGYRRRAVGSGGPLAPPGVGVGPGGDGALCHANTCRRPAPHSLRRKWLVKMRSSVSKVVQLDLDYPGLHTIPLCDVHYQAISHLMVCGLCKRGLARNHVHYINQEYQALNPLIAGLGLPVVFQEKPVVCKMCRYFCTLLLRPPSQHQLNKQAFLNTYRRRLMQAHNLDVPEEFDGEVNEDISASDTSKDQSDAANEKRKGKIGKSKTKKSSDVRKSTEDGSIKRSNAENSPHFESNKKDGMDSWKDRHNIDKTASKCTIEEDIESLISTNTIPIPNANSKPGSHSDTPARPNSEVSDNSDLDMMIDYDNPLISAMDKQSELQYLLQKCNVPSSTILQRGPISNLTQKSRNILKVHNSPAISKTSSTQKIHDKNARRIQKLGQIITKNSDIEKALCGKLPNRDEFTIEPAATAAGDAAGLNMLRNIALNDECTIETIPSKTSSKGVDFNSLKCKLQMSDSFTQIKKNLKALSSRLSDDPSKKKKSDQQDSRYSNPVRRLETNPSISVRELFPGEEEMNLHCSIEFGNVKGITPEGWEKCNTTIQYDSDTKKLWHELQKPYGNQSSFLRHLILLEKYFRNGDLILAHNANCNAVTYSESVQNRLRSYDNIPSNGEPVHLPFSTSLLPKNSSLTVVQHTPSPPPLLPPETVLETVKRSDSSSLIEFRRHKANAVAGKSLLKTNQSVSAEHTKSQLHKGAGSIARPLDSFLPASVNHAKIPKNVPISIAQINQSVDQAFNASKIPKNIPLSLSQLEKLSNQLPQIHVPVTPRPPTPRPDATKSASEFVRPPSLPPSIAVETKTTTPKTDSMHSKPRAPSLPPELIAINSQHSSQRKSIENVLKNIQQLAKGSSTPVSHPAPPPSLQTPGMSPISTAQPTVRAESEDGPTLSEQPAKKSKGSSKQWRPTLIPITDESKLRNARDVLYQTADGRRLPSLVQVMSGGKPYHITIQDYNRMCVMRREKLQQMQRAELSKKSSGSATSLMHGISLDTSVDMPVISTIAAPFNKPASPVTTLPDVSNVQITASSKNADQLSPASVKSPQNKVETLPDKPSPAGTPDLNSVSLLKNVSLKNITIAPITSANDGRTSKSPASTVGPSSLLITTTDSAVSIPSIISQLGASISITAESSVAKGNAGGVPVQAPAAVLLPKIPKSLTVIPQTIVPAPPKP